jgi:hypothetical protein
MDSINFKLTDSSIQSNRLATGKPQQITQKIHTYNKFAALVRSLFFDDVVSYRDADGNKVHYINKKDFIAWLKKYEPNLNLEETKKQLAGHGFVNDIVLRVNDLEMQRDAAKKQIQKLLEGGVFDLDPYDVLGCKKDDALEQIKIAWLALKREAAEKPSENPLLPHIRDQINASWEIIAQQHVKRR